VVDPGPAVDKGYRGAPHPHSARTGTLSAGNGCADVRRCGSDGSNPARILTLTSRESQQLPWPPAHQKITEDRCLTEERAPYLTPFLPSGTDPPRKSELQPDCRLDGQPAAAVFTVGIRLRDPPDQPRSPDQPQKAGLDLGPRYFRAAITLSKAAIGIGGLLQLADEAEFGGVDPG
jgi:hypothetical protein